MVEITKLDAKTKGILLIVLSAFCFAGMNICVRMSGELPVMQKSFFRNLVAVVVAAIVLAREKQGFLPVDRRNWRYLLIRSFFGVVGVLCNFYAVDHLVLSDASMLNKMSPFFAVLASMVILKEKLSPLQVFTLAGAFAGAMCIVKPTLSNMALIPSLAGLAGGLSAGIAYTMVRLLGQKGERGSYTVFVFSGFSCLVMLPKLLFDYAPMTTEQLLLLLGAGVCAAGGQFCITAAYRCAPAREISVYDYSQVIFSAAIGFVLFGDVPDRYSVLGYILICGMAVLNFWYNVHYLPKKQSA